MLEERLTYAESDYSIHEISPSKFEVHIHSIQFPIFEPKRKFSLLDFYVESIVFQGMFEFNCKRDELPALLLKEDIRYPYFLTDSCQNAFEKAKNIIETYNNYKEEILKVLKKIGKNKKSLLKKLPHVYEARPLFKKWGLTYL